MKVIQVYYDTCDSWSGQTKYLKIIAKDVDAAVRFIAQYENKSIEDAQKMLENEPYWSTKEVEVFE